MEGGESNKPTNGREPSPTKRLWSQDSIGLISKSLHTLVPALYIGVLKTYLLNCTVDKIYNKVSIARREGYMVVNLYCE